MRKATYEITQPPHMTDEEFEGFTDDIDSIIEENLCIDCDYNDDCKGGIACKYYIFNRSDN